MVMMPFFVGVSTVAIFAMIIFHPSSPSNPQFVLIKQGPRRRRGPLNIHQPFPLLAKNTFAAPEIMIPNSSAPIIYYMVGIGILAYWTHPAPSIRPMETLPTKKTRHRLPLKD